MRPNWLAWTFVAILAAAIPAAVRAQRPPAQDNSSQSQPPQLQSGEAPNAAAGGATGAPVRLHLTADQRDKIKAIRQDQIGQIQAARNDSTLTGPEKHQKIQQIRDNTEQQIMALLTPDQQAAWKQLRAEHQQNHKPASPSAGSAGGNSSSGSGVSSPHQTGPASTPPSPD